MLISKFLNQIVVWEKALRETDIYGATLFESPVELPARVENVVKNVMQAEGSIVIATRRVFLAQPVSVGDRLDGRVVLLVQDMPNFQGVIQGWEVST